MNINEVFNAIDVYMKRSHKDTIDEGKVAILNAGRVEVILSGSNQPQRAIAPRGQNLQIGDDVVVVRPYRSNRWIIVGTIGLPGSVPTTGSPSTKFEIYPPSRFRTENLAAGIATLTWDAPIQQSVAFDVQVSPDQISVERLLTTRGSYAMIKIDGVMYARIRSLSSNGRFSSWSSWITLQAAPLSESPGGFASYLFDHTTPNASPIVTLKPNAIVRRVQVVVDEPFTLPMQISVGQVGNLEYFFSRQDANLQQIGDYSHSPLIQLPEETVIDFYRSGDSITGVGRIFIFY